MNSTSAVATTPQTENPSGMRWTPALTCISLWLILIRPARVLRFGTIPILSGTWRTISFRLARVICLFWLPTSRTLSMWACHTFHIRMVLKYVTSFGQMMTVRRSVEEFWRRICREESLKSICRRLAAFLQAEAVCSFSETD
jgi:hypothetical protein